MLNEAPLTAYKLRVADLRFNESVFLQEARPRRLTLDFLDNGCVELRLEMPRTAFGVATDGGLGDPVPASYLKLEPVQLLANSAVAVAADGFPRYRLLTQPFGTEPGRAYNTLTQQVEVFGAGQDWLGFLRAKPEELELQDHFFGRKCQNEQVSIIDLLQAYSQQADAPPSVFAVQ